MKQTSQSGLSTLKIIIILAVAAIVLAVISLLTAPSQEQAAQQAANSTAEGDTPFETFAQNAAEDIAAPATDAMEKNEENKAEMADLMADDTMDLDAAPTDDTTPAVVESTSDPEPVTVAAAGSFSDYDESKLTADGTNVLFFHADWCPSCKGLERDLNANAANIPEGVNILKLDYDSETELKKKYGVIRQHTLIVVDFNGNEIKKLTGLTNTLDQVVNQL